MKKPVDEFSSKTMDCCSAERLEKTPQSVPDQASSCACCGGVARISLSTILEPPIKQAAFGIQNEKALDAIDRKAVSVSESQKRFSTFFIAEMDCAVEESLIRNKLSSLDGIYALDFNLMQRTLRIKHDPAAFPEIVAAFSALGMEAKRLDIKSPVPETQQSTVNWGKLFVAGGLAFACEVLEIFYGSIWIVPALALLSIGLGGLSTYKKGWVALKNLDLNINALMSIAVTGAMFIGQWPEAAMVMVLFTLAETIEAKSLGRARNAIRGLMAFTPDRATVQQPDGGWVNVEAGTIAVGCLVRVEPGERIALDGEILEGCSTINQAAITGESLPVEKNAGDMVFAGTLNESGSFVYRVTARAEKSTLAGIIQTIEQAQNRRAPTQRFIEQFARYYTPAIFVLSVAVAVLPPLLAGALWMTWVYRALVLLVISCPCALVISTPISIVSALASAARKGILVKGGVYLEKAHQLRWLALDKTGTLTRGQPVQTSFETWQGAEPRNAWILASSLAARSDHPVSKALASAAEKNAIALLEINDFMALPGYGIQARIGETTYYLVNHRKLEALGLCSPELEKRLFELESKGESVVVLAGETKAIALFGVADTVKESSRQAIAELHSLGIKTVMLTGDNQHTAENIAAQVGIDRALGSLLPEDKLHEVEKLLQEGKVGMVGDGINDAPALARADIGFAMGVAGSDTAVETADVALMNDDLRKIPVFIRLSQATAAILKQNIMIAIGIKTAFVCLAFSGKASMWMAVFADVGASLLVIFNGLRLLRK